MTAPPRPPEPQYRGGQLDPARGPGLGCFYVQIVLLVVLVVLTPLSAYAGWPAWLSAALLFATIGLLLVTGQTIIFLLRIVAAERGQRRPLAGRSRTVGELAQESDAAGSPAAEAREDAPLSGSEPAAPTELGTGQASPTDDAGMRQ